MPSKDIDYSETHFYKIVCKDLNVMGCYIGHTTNFRTRKGCHKRVCNNPNSNRHHLTVYKFIRENGGWENFDMVLIETRNCKNALEARKLEREFIETNEATLNIHRPYSSENEKVEQKNQWYKDNQDEVKAKVSKRNQSKSDEIKQYNKEYYKITKEKHIQKSKEYYQENSDKIKDYAKNYYEENKKRQKRLRLERYYRLKNKDE